jgi:ABC-type phosphate transport system permease subunit
LLANGQTLGSAIVSFFSEATGVQRSAVIGLAVVLLAFTTVTNIGGQLLLRRRGGQTRGLSAPDALLPDADVAPA